MIHTFCVKCIIGAGMLMSCLFATTSGWSQESDLARIEYTFIPQVNSENSVNRFRAFLNCPIKVGSNGSYIIPGIEYRNTAFDIKDPVPYENADLGIFQLFRASLAYTFKTKTDWRVALKTGIEIASNFEEHEITSRDLSFTGAIFLIRDRSSDEVEKPNRLVIGLNYSTNAGRPFPIPIINYHRRFHPKWSYSLGSPKTNLKHFWNKKNTIQSFITLDGFFSNIQKNRRIQNLDGTFSSAENISMTLVFGGLGYEYAFTKHLLFYAYGGYTFYNEIRLRDKYDNTLYRLNEENTFYFRTGLKFKI